MKVKEVMTKSPDTVTLNQSLQDAATLMKQLNVGVLPVVNNGHVIGMITDRDIATRAGAEGRDPRTTTVRQAMTASAYCVYEDRDVKEAAAIMKDYRIRRLPVLNQQERLVGIVSLGDIAVNASSREAERVLESVCNRRAAHIGAARWA